MKPRDLAEELRAQFAVVQEKIGANYKDAEDRAMLQLLSLMVEALAFLVDIEE